MNIYTNEYKDLYGKQLKLEHFHDKVLLVVNFTINCNFTDQLKQLSVLADKYRDDGLVVLLIPTNEFYDHKETNESIQLFINLHYENKFQVLDLMDITSNNALYDYLTSNVDFNIKDDHNQMAIGLRDHISSILPENSKSNNVQWNYTKFLISKKGNTIYRYETTIEPFAFEDTIIKLINDN